MRLPNGNQIVSLASIIVSVLLIAFVVLQNRSGGLSGVFGGSGSVIQARRGAEKWLFVTTIILSVVFVGLSVAAIILKSK